MRCAVERSGFRNGLRAASTYPIVQAKAGPDPGCGADLRFALANALEILGREAVVFQVVEPRFDPLAQVVRLGAPGVSGQKIKALSGIGVEADGGGHDCAPGRSPYSVDRKKYGNGARQQTPSQVCIQTSAPQHLLPPG